MLEIIAIIFMTRWVLNLAKKYNKPNAWVYGLIAVLLYIVFGYGSAFLLMAFAAPGGNMILYGLLGIPIGFLAIFIFRTILDSAWKKEVNNSDQVLDDTSEF